MFGLVANRALAPSSKLAAADWINHDVHTDGLPETSDDACYRAMDWLHDVRDHLERAVFHQVANLLNLEVDPAAGDGPGRSVDIASATGRTTQQPAEQRSKPAVRANARRRPGRAHA